MHAIALILDRELTVSLGISQFESQFKMVCVHVCVRVCVCVCMHVCVHACVCACVPHSEGFEGAAKHARCFYRRGSKCILMKILLRRCSVLHKAFGCVFPETTGNDWGCFLC